MSAITAASNLIGVAITMPTACRRCHGFSAVVGAGRGPHAASLWCACGRHAGWISHESFNFIAETVRRFGRPTSPIQISRRNAEQSSRTPSDAGRDASKLASIERPLKNE
jgi:hypothetical protein